MTTHNIILPKLGESVTDATLIKWLVKKGDTVKENQVVAEIATDKVDSDVFSEFHGIVENLFFKENDVIQVGETMLTLLQNEKESKTSKPESSKNLNRKVKTQKESKTVNEKKKPASQTFQNTTTNKKKKNTFLSPLVISIIQQEQIPFEEVTKLVGSGADGRVTKKDILEYSKLRKTTKENITAKNPVSVNSTGTTLSYELIEMDRMRKIISQKMLESQKMSAHVTSFSEADVTNIFKWRKEKKREYYDKYGQVLTLTHLFIEASIKALQKFPLINSSVENDKIAVYKNINIGIAVALKNNNLIVPVLKNSHTLNLNGIVSGMNGLVEKSRNNKLSPDDLKGGTFTLSNIGNFGSMMGTPIINQPQVAILATGFIKKRPAVVETEYGDLVAVRQHMFLSLSYDHRIIDGALGSLFLKEMVHILETFDLTRSV